MNLATHGLYAICKTFILVTTNAINCYKNGNNKLLVLVAREIRKLRLRYVKFYNK